MSRPAAPAVPAHAHGPISFPESLPVSARRAEIAAALAARQVVIVCGETGSGKTTQLPKLALALGRGKANGGKLIGHTQPRRIAASSVARRIAQELDTPVGEVVGYKVRFQDRLTPGASIKLMTDGILLAETQSDPLLSAYDTLIIDEAHERSLNIDFLLGYLREVLPQRPDLKVIVTSATIDAERFAKHFESAAGPAPVIQVSGRMFPVEQRWRPYDAGTASAPSAAKPGGASPARSSGRRDRDLNDAIADAVDELWLQGSGDILVFLPGEREIRDAADHLRKHAASVQSRAGPVEILPLFARLSQAEQDRVFEAGNGRRIVLATNVAETSLTVPGIRYVIDSGEARVKRYSYRNKVEQLQVEPISQAAANQRAGRCGRVAHGVCIRLYDEQDFAGRPRFTDPEILRSSLAVTYRIAFGPRAGQKVLTLGGATPRESAARQPLCADIDGFSLHAAVRVEAHDRKRLEQLCRYITRSALSDERVQVNAAGQVELKLKTPWRDGTTHLVMSPLEFMQRLATLVPRPRLHLIRFGVRTTSLREVSGPPLRAHGVLAPNAKLRPMVVPQGPEVQEQADEAAVAGECAVETVQARPRRISWARLLKRVFSCDIT